MIKFIYIYLSGFIFVFLVCVITLIIQERAFLEMIKNAIWSWFIFPYVGICKFVDFLLHKKMIFLFKGDWNLAKNWNLMKKKNRYPTTLEKIRFLFTSKRKILDRKCL